MLSDEGSEPRDPAPLVGAATDVTSLGRSGPKPAHERTADEEPDVVNWNALAASRGFQELLRVKRRFIIPALFVFVLYYFALPVLVGYGRPIMERRAIGAVNIAYLFALSQFFMAWIIAALYIRAAPKFDVMARQVIEHEGGQTDERT